MVEETKGVTFAEAVMGEKHEELLQVLKYGLCKCGYHGDETHTCPYQEDLYGSAVECNCCPACTKNCINDI